MGYIPSLCLSNLVPQLQAGWVGEFLIRRRGLTYGDGGDNHGDGTDPDGDF